MKPSREAASRTNTDKANFLKSSIRLRTVASHFSAHTSSSNIPYSVRAFQDINEFSHRLCARPFPVHYATHKMADGWVGSGLRH